MKNIIETIYGLMQALDIRVTKTTIIKEVNEHQDSQTLLGFSEILSKWGITNAAYNLSAEELNQDYSPFIAYMNMGIKQFEFAVVKTINDQTVTLHNEHWKNYVMERKEFDKLYGGAALLVEPEDNAGEANYKNNRQREILNGLREPFAIGAFALLVSGFFIQDHTVVLQSIMLLLLNTSGLLLSALIVYQGIQKDSKLVKTLCLSGKNGDCNAIINSEASKIFSWLSWGEVGLLYFSGIFLVSLFCNATPGITQALAVFSALCLPYVIYSISYQAFIAKKWCIMCSAIMAVLTLEFLLLYGQIANPAIALTRSGWYQLALCLVAPAAVWSMIKPWLVSAAELLAAKKTLAKFKNNDALFKKVLSEQPSYDLPNPDYSIVLGNPASKNIITIVSNPYCNPCSEAHKTIDQWLSVTDDLQVRVILTKSPNDQTVRHLVALNNKGDAKLIKHALNDWYKQRKKDYPAWAKKYPANLDSADCDHVLQQQSDWCASADVRFTPLVIVNGHQLPENYLIEDLKYLI